MSCVGRRSSPLQEVFALAGFSHHGNGVEGGGRRHRDIVDDVRGRLRIRLLGIDTPETKKPGYTVGCWGPEATEFAKSTLLGQRVAFVTDPSQGMYDRFGRTLAYLDKADGWDYSVEAARAGAAHSYVYHGHPSARADEIAAAEQEAKAAGRGLWGPPCFGQTTSVPI